MSDAVLSVFTLYRNPRAAVAWLQEALGFTVVSQFADEAGHIAHAELRLGQAVVMVQQAQRGHLPPPVLAQSTSRAPVICLGDELAVDELFLRAVRAGAHVLVEPETTAWGNHRFELLDPEGHQWSVGSYVPGRGW